MTSWVRGRPVLELCSSTALPSLSPRVVRVSARGIPMKLEFRWLVCGMCSALALALVPVVASAQMGGQQCSDIQMLQHKCGEQQSKKSDKQQDKHESKYPNATRKQPSNAGVSAKEGKTLNEGLQAANSGDSATALKDLQPIADSSSSAYAKSLAMLGLAQVKYRSG